MEWNGVAACWLCSSRATGPTAANPRLWHAAAGWDGQTDEKTGGQTQDHFIDPALHYYAGSVNKSMIAGKK